MWLPNEILTFVWHGCSYSAHNTAKFSDWSVCQIRHFSLVNDIFYDISTSICLHPTKFQPHILLIHKNCASHISCMNPWAYATKGTIRWGEMPRNPDTLHRESHEVSQSISTPTPQIIYLHFIKYTFCNKPHFLHRNPRPCDIPPHKARDSAPMGPEKELISHVSVIP